MSHQAKVFSLAEAKSLLPWIAEISEAAEQQLFQVQQEIREPQALTERQFHIIHHWAETVIKLGASPKQPFTVDFDSGHDFYCWSYPERDILYRHDYDRGYAGRHLIEEEK